GAYAGALRIANRPAPASLADAQYSIPYCLGLAAHHGPQVLLPMTEKHLGDAAAEALARKVVIAIDPDCDARFPAETVVRVTLHARGRQFASAITAPRGEAAQPPTWDERLDKFRTATASRLPPAVQRRWLASFAALHDGRLDELRRLLACAPA